ncbi:MAG: sorbosone dehydrogenase, partial [Burkholderiales bacterium PBB5]
MAGVLLTACGETARLTVSDGTGPRPLWVSPNPTLIPTVNIAPARGWPVGATPRAAADTRVTAFATGLDHPRWLLVLPNGDVLVAETNAPPRPDDGNGLRGFVMGLVMKRAGAAAPSANRITLLRDSRGSGVADVRSVLLEGLNAPFGMVLVGNDLYVANTDAILRFPYTPGQTRSTAPGVVLARLPAGDINHHWTKNLMASADGRKLYVTVGSNSNVAERGMAAEAERAAIWEVDISTGAHRVYAS